LPNKNSIEVRNLVKTYGDVYALKNVDLDIADGEYFVLLGPSGGGKTTLLRSIGGFIRPDSGTVQIKGKNVDNLPPDKRPTSMVFQGFALFPHMTVSENIGYGLKLRSVEKSIIHDKVIKMMDLVGLSGLSDRKPHELSGGQQQRVQLARALILENDVLLLDEPLSALDAQLRKDMCIELKRLQKTVGISFVHVTHNQEEAMSVADRIAIIADGEMVEQGSPKEIYSNPKKKFTAEFIGEKNILNGVVVDFNKSKILVNIEKDEIEVANNNYTIAKNQEISLSIKSESIQISKVSSSKSKGAKNSITGKVTEITFLGQFIRYLVLLSNNQEIQVRSNNEIEALA
jgi:ABC-type Fe3+/spermidine/putrescine transport system ATPase subunit